MASTVKSTWNLSGQYLPQNMGDFLMFDGGKLFLHSIGSFLSLLSDDRKGKIQWCEHPGRFPFLHLVPLADTVGICSQDKSS